MAKGAPKTQAMRALDARGVPYRVLVYGTDGAFHPAVEVAALLGLPPEEVYKTIVVLPDEGKPLLVMLAAHREIDLRLLARALGRKRLRLASLNEAESLTGLKAGCISPVSLLARPFEVVLDRPGAALDHLVLSAGQRGLQLEVTTADLLALTGALVVEVTAEGDTGRS